MQISVDKTVLSNAITAALAGFQPTKTYKDVGWLYVKDDLATIVLRGSPGGADDSVEIDFPVKVITAGRASLPLRKILTGIDNSPGDIVTLQAIAGTSGGGQIRAKCGSWIYNGNILLDVLEPKRWTEPSTRVRISSVAAVRGILTRAVRGMVPDTTGPVSFLQLQISEGRIDATGACNYKFANGSLSEADLDTAAMTYIAHAAFGRVTALLKQLDGAIELGLEQGRFCFRADSLRYSLAGPADDPSSFLAMFDIPEIYNIAKVSGKELRSALQAISIAIDNQRGGYIDLKIMSESLKVSAKDDESSEQTITAQADKAITLCFKHEYLMAILVGAKDLIIRYSNQESTPSFWIHADDELGAQFMLAGARRS